MSKLLTWTPCIDSKSNRGCHFVSNCDFEHFFTSHRNKNDFFWNPEIKLAQKHTFCYSKIPIGQFDLMWLRGLTSPFTVVRLPGVRLQNGFDFFFNSTCKSDYKSCATCPKIYSFYSGYLLWPDLDHDLYFCDAYAHRVSSIALWGYFGIVSSKSLLPASGFIVQKR